MLCAILAAVNLITTFFLLPETLFEPGAETDSLNLSDEEKNAGNHLDEYRDNSGRLWRSLLSPTCSNAAKEKGVLKHWLHVFYLPLPMVLNPGVFIASIMFGVMLGW
jgi:hypothetical protein